MIFSRYPVGQVFRHLLPYPVDPGVNGMLRIALEAVIEAPFGSVRVITSQHGHDAFLIEAEQVGACLGELLAAIPGHAPGGATPTRRGSARLKQCRGRISG